MRLFRSCTPRRPSWLWVVAPLALAVVLVGCNGEAVEDEEPETETYDQTLDPVEESEGFVALFDGTDLEAWRGFQTDEVAGVWTIDERGALRAGQGENNPHLMTADAYSNFDFRLDFWVPEGGRSGIVYLVAENEYDEPGHAGPEFLLVDNDGLEDAAPEERTGAKYGVLPPDFDAFTEAGAWQSARVVKDGDLIQHWLNDDLVLSYEIGSPEWQAQVDQTDFAEYPTYGQHDEGHVVLRHAGDEVRFRNIRIHTW